MWFIFSILVMILWGAADLFYKKSANPDEKYSHLKTVVAVGIIMGIHGIFTLFSNNLDYNFKNILIYLPVSSMYILSMAIGYFGLKYLELSISSPIQNSSEIITSILCFFLLHEELDFISLISIILIGIGLIFLGVIEKNKNNDENANKKYKIGFIAFFIPIIYCIVDSLGTFFDAYYLEISTTPLIGFTEDNLELVANISYEFTFLITAIIALVFLLIKRANTSKETVKTNIFAAIFETIGQFFYVYAMSGNAIIAAPMVSAYCIVSMIFSRVFLKEKLTKKEYFSLALIIIGIIILGIMEAV